MNLEYYFKIANFLNDGIRNAYKGGIIGVTKSNKERLQFSDGIYSLRGIELLNHVTFNDRKLYEVDYTLTDYEALQNFKTEVFYTAGIGSYELDRKLNELAADVWKNKNQDEIEFKRLAREEIIKYVPYEKVPYGSWLDTNFHTSIASAHHGAEWIRLQEPFMRELYPAYQYMTRNDNRVRKNHQELHTRIWLAEDKIWLTIYPPNGWNCRCFIIMIDLDELRNVQVENLTSKDTRAQIVNKSDIPNEFRRNPGESKSIWGKWLDSELKGLDYNSVYKSMVDYSNKYIPEGSRASFDVNVLKTASEKFGEYEKKMIKNYDAELILISSDKDTSDVVKSIVRNPDEVWGEIENMKIVDKDGSSIRQSTNFYIKFTNKGIVIVEVLNSEIIELHVTDLEGLGKFRRGVLMKKKNPDADK